MCLYLGADVLAAARPWGAGEAPGHTSWAIPAPGERLQAPSWLPHPAPILLARGLGSSFCRKGLGMVAASLSLPPEAWVLASVLGGNSVHPSGPQRPHL